MSEVEDSRDRAYRDCGYSERNKLVAFLTRIYPAHLADHPASDASWEDEWRTIVFVDSPAGQLSWHIHVSDAPLFAHLARGMNNWDGHTTEEKYERLAAIRPDWEEE